MQPSPQRQPASPGTGPPGAATGWRLQGGGARLLAWNRDEGQKAVTFRHTQLRRGEASKQAAGWQSNRWQSNQNGQAGGEQIACTTTDGEMDLGGNQLQAVTVAGRSSKGEPPLLLLLPVRLVASTQAGACRQLSAASRQAAGPWVRQCCVQACCQHRSLLSEPAAAAGHTSGICRGGGGGLAGSQRALGPAAVSRGGALGASGAS